ncbi:hypothetical protein SNOG_15037 [Parastagonospora nodorum SN15]|uniref:Uncharacterized protein n=1 Tax=Phaeosphaeria nodorum (strain SN15 / ATCC MYA-4574 / FGSC 10173) TaxID=321614 RepID=Q0TZM5_PHANO|nr:hypothetical protein SNOG_15037 [Parastagonospora nodorum SN15]EAT77580.1 hypothetical protein SNOG_15037 [Parastagonospora nodorum SN15]
MAASNATAFKSDRKLLWLAMEEANGLRRQEKVGSVRFSQRNYMTLEVSKAFLLSETSAQGWRNVQRADALHPPSHLPAQFR